MSKKTGFTVGAKVTWKANTGKIVAVVPAECYPDDYIPRKYEMASREYLLVRRDHRSYLVYVEEGGRKKLYRPRVVYLRLA